MGASRRGEVGICRHESPLPSASGVEIPSAADKRAVGRTNVEASRGGEREDKQKSLAFSVNLVVTFTNKVSLVQSTAKPYFWFAPSLN